MPHNIYCARCGSKVDAERQRVVWMRDWHRVFGRDLCPSCVLELEEWLKPRRHSTKAVGVRNLEDVAGCGDQEQGALDADAS